MKASLHQNQCTVPEIITILQDSTNSMRNLHQKDHAFLPAHSRANQDQDIIQRNNNMKTLASAKEQYGLSKRSEKPRDCWKPRDGNTSTDKVYFVKQII